jgi:hypothetical protein
MADSPGRWVDRPVHGVEMRRVGDGSGDLGIAAVLEDTGSSEGYLDFIRFASYVIMVLESMRITLIINLVLRMESCRRFLIKT